jgi:DNA polymerase-1
MMEKLGYGDLVFTKKKASGYCVDEEVMEKLVAEGCDLAELILDRRKVGKLKSTYLNKALNDLDDDGRIRYSWMIHGTKSGRLSCEFLHQVSRSDSERTKAGKNNLRDILVAEPGFSLVYADYDQIELRILAIEANDKELQRVFANNEDVHQATASAALDILYADVSDENRQLGKSINFGISYGSKGYSLSRKNYFVDPKDGKKKKVTKNMVVKFLGRFHEKFIGIANYLERIPYEAAARNGLIITVFGRERHIAGLNDSNRGRRNHAEREAVNNLIQSPAGAITLRTAIEVYKMLKKYNIKSDIVRFVNTVHDSLVYEVRKDYVLWFREALKVIAERKIPELQNNSFPISIGVGDSWGAAELNSKGK